MTLADSEHKGKQFIMVTFGVLLMVIGQYFFLLPEQILAGGASGMALIVSQFIHLPYSVLLLIINIILLIVGYIFIGKSFGILTLYSILLSSGLFAVFERIIPLSGPPVEDTMLNMMIGTLINGIGVGTVFNAGASTGGTDILAGILRKYTRFTFSQGTLLVDGVLLILAFSTFGLRRGLYATLVVLSNSTIIDKMISGGEGRFQVTIISNKNKKINEFIIHKLNRSTTVYNAEGGYSGQPRHVLTSVVGGRQLVTLKQFTRNNDPNAFFYVSSITDISGEGFTYTSEEDKTQEHVEQHKEDEMTEESPADQGEMF